MFKRMILVVCCTLGSAGYARAMERQLMYELAKPLVRNMTIGGACGIFVPGVVTLLGGAAVGSQNTNAYSVPRGGFYGASGGLLVHAVFYAISKNCVASAFANLFSGVFGIGLGCAACFSK